MSRTKAIFAGLVAGLLGGIVMTTVMLLLAALGVATTLVIIGDRLSVFIPPVPFPHGQGRRVQSSEANWRWIDNRRPTRSERDWRSDFRIVRATQSAARVRDVDDIDLCFAADRCRCYRALAGPGHKLHWPAYRRRAPGHTHRLRAVRFFVRANPRPWLSISGNAKNLAAGLRVYSRYWSARVCPERYRSRSSGRRCCAGPQTLSCCNIQLRRDAIQGPHRRADYA